MAAGNSLRGPGACSSVGSSNAASVLPGLPLKSEEVFASGYFYAARFKTSTHVPKSSFSLASYKPLYYAHSGAGAQSRLMGASRASPTERLVASCLIMNGLQKAHFPVLRSDSQHAAAPAARAGFWSHMEQPVTHAVLYSG